MTVIDFAGSAVSYRSVANATIKSSLVRIEKDPALPGMPAVKVKFNNNYDQEQYKKTNLTANSSQPCTGKKPRPAFP